MEFNADCNAISSVTRNPIANINCKTTSNAHHNVTPDGRAISNANGIAYASLNTS